jgi:hypothetical protein
MIQFKGGRLPPDPSKARLTLRNYLTPTGVPRLVDYLSKVERWPMYDNDKIGDCTCAGIAHVLEAEATYGEGTTVTVTDEDVLTAYEAVSGYNPRTGANDNGARMQDVLSYWRKTGLAGHKILAFAQVDEKDATTLDRALATFGALYVGINFPASAMDQFNAGKPWDVVQGSPIEGRHAIHVGYYGPDEPASWRLVTWGTVHPMTQKFWESYVEEAWVVITPEWLNAHGTSPEGLDLQALGEDFAQLTGEPNPFPAPEPGPVPQPAPTPVDVVDDALAVTAKRWLAGRPTFYVDVQAALMTWLTGKGYETTPST